MHVQIGEGALGQPFEVGRRSVEGGDDLPGSGLGVTEPASFTWTSKPLATRKMR